MISAASQPIDVLMVDDSPEDIRLVEEAWRGQNRSVHLHSVLDGHEALSFLRREGAFAGSPRPRLVLLDLNLPLMDGRDVLATIKADAQLKSIPVIILTTSKAEDDIARAYALSANCYITKPRDLDQFFEVVRSIESFWFKTVNLPPKVR